MSPSPRRAVALRALAAGAVGGVAAALVDHVWSHAETARTLPSGEARLLLALVALYAAGGALVGAAAGLGLALCGWATDLGAIATRALDGNQDEPRRPGARWAALLVGAVVAIGLHGLATYGVALTALYRFHAHLPIAAVVGGAAAALAVPALLVAFLVGSALSPLVRVGPRLDPRLVAPVGWNALFWLGGLGGAAVGVLLLADAIQLRPRMTVPMRAINIALWAPILVAAIVIAAHVLGRLAWALVGKSGVGARVGAICARPLPSLALIWAITAAAIWIALRLTWATAKLVDWRPYGVMAAWAVATSVAATLGFGARFGSWRRRTRVLVGVVTIAVLLVVARRAEGPDRVRKATFQTGLAPHLLTALQASWDVDRDGYPSTLVLGSDCDDRDPEVHPGAFDWPDDGIDQNCNGHEATTRLPPRPPFPAVPPSVPKKLNVVLITIDALRADHVGAYGYARPTTPNIDALAKQGVRFANGWAHSPSTRYSVPAILIGRYESTIAWNPDPRVHWPPLVLPENRLISEALHDRGYHTGALVPAHYFEPGWGLTQGFDDYDNSLARLHGNINSDPAKATGSSSRELADLAIQWLDKNANIPTWHDAEPAAPKPFFLWMHFYDPHYVYERHPDCKTCSFGNGDVDLYDGEVRYTDEHLGRVLDELKRLGRWDDTIVIVTADHGEGFGEHGVKMHGYHIYAQQNKVPFIVRVPGIAPRTVDSAVGHVDLFPSILDLVGAPDEPQLLGRSFVDLMTGAASDDRKVFGEVEYEGPVVRKSVATRDWHLIENVVPDGTFELYHVGQDPQEAQDLDGTGEAAEDALKYALAEWMDESALPPRFAERVAGNLSDKPFPAQRPLDARIGDLLAVDGVDVATPTVHPGDYVDVALMLRALKPIPSGKGGWHLYTHLAAPTGRFLNADHEPVEGFVPLGKLRPSQYVRDRLHVLVPRDWPAGPLTVELGLFRGGERARVAGGGAAGDHVVAAQIQVLPPTQATTPAP